MGSSLFSVLDSKNRLTSDVIGNDPIEVELGSSRGGVWQWESGEIAPTADRLWEICEVLQCTPAELFSTADEVDLDLEDD